MASVVLKTNGSPNTETRSVNRLDSFVRSTINMVPCSTAVHDGIVADQVALLSAARRVRRASKKAIQTMILPHRQITAKGKPVPSCHCAIVNVRMPTTMKLTKPLNAAAARAAAHSA